MLPDVACPTCLDFHYSKSKWPSFVPDACNPARHSGHLCRALADCFQHPQPGTRRAWPAFVAGFVGRTSGRRKDRNYSG